jgi:hypothetical protein
MAIGVLQKSLAGLLGLALLAGRRRRKRAIRPMPPRALPGRWAKCPTAIWVLVAPSADLKRLVDDLNIKRKASMPNARRPSMPRWRNMPLPRAAS